MKKIKTLSEFPSHIKENDLVDYFMYLYSFSFPREPQKRDISGYREYMNNRYEQMKNLFSPEKTWWLMTFIYMRDILILEGSDYGIETVNFLISQCENIDISTLSEYAEKINQSMQEIYPNALKLRPTVEGVVSQHIDTENKEIKKLVRNRRKIISMMAESFEKEYVNKDFRDLFIYQPEDLMYKFSSFWEVYYDILLLNVTDMWSLIELTDDGTAKIAVGKVIECEDEDVFEAQEINEIGVKELVEICIYMSFNEEDLTEETEKSIKKIVNML